jgi:HEAT repeat protein
LDQAVDAVLETLGSTDPEVRLRAARLVLDVGSRLTDRVEIDELVHKLEERLADPDSGGRRS